LQSLLSGRFQIVKNHKFSSTQFHVPSDVPQGDLYTLLFSIFINSLSIVITHSYILLFADNAKLVKIIKSEQDSFNLQSNMNNVLMNCLFLIINKCKFMLFHLIINPINFQYSIFNSKIELVPQFIYLSLIFDSKINFASLTEMIKNIAFCNLGFIKYINGSFLDLIPLKILYCSLVRSNLEYCPLI